MAQPKNRQRRGEAKEKSPNRVELENLEKKTEAIVQKRNEFNRLAQLAREERDLLNTKKKEIFGQLNKAKEEREAFNQELREHKELRNEYQRQAKELIAKKRHKMKKEDQALRSPGLRAQELKAEIADLEFRQQTTVISTHEENELLKQIRLKRHEYDVIKKEAAKAAKLQVDLSDTDKAIDTLFAKAEEEHQKVVALYKQSQGAHDRFMKLFNEAATVAGEADKHHHAFLEHRGKADEQHQLFLELREKMLELKGKEFADRREARVIIKEQQRRVRDAVANPEKLKEAADSALEQLKKSGKISLR